MAPKGSNTKDNLKRAFAGESQANRRYLYFAQKADVDGYKRRVGGVSLDGRGETGHAHGHLEYLEVVGDPAPPASCPSETPRTTSRPPSPGRPTSTRTCIRAKGPFPPRRPDPDARSDPRRHGCRRPHATIPVVAALANAATRSRPVRRLMECIDHGAYRHALEPIPSQIRDVLLADLD